MDWIEPWLGNVFEVGLRRELAGAICLLASSICGAVIGLERERRDKPAGLRTVVLIALGSTIFTLVSCCWPSESRWPTRRGSRPRSFRESAFSAPARSCAREARSSA